MAVKIRLKRMGKIRAPYYRIVVADSRTKRDGRVIEEIGKYHPKQDPSFIEVDSDRVQYWLGVGAQPTEPVAAILKVTGDWQKFRGESAPEPMRVAEPRRDRTALFNEALKDSRGEPADEAVTPRRTTKRAQPAREETTQPASPAAGGTARDSATANDGETADSAAPDAAAADTAASDTAAPDTAAPDNAEGAAASTESAEAGSETGSVEGEGTAAGAADGRESQDS